MLKHQTALLSFTHWGLLQARLQADIEEQHAAVMALLEPVVVGVDTKGYQERLARSQKLFEQGVARLENMRLLNLSMTVQLDAARYEAGVLPLKARVELFERLEAFYTGVSKDRPSRAAAEQAIAQLQSAFTSASKPSGGEWAATERGRLLSTTVEVPVLAAEDAPNFAQTAQCMRNDLTGLRIQLDALQSTTQLVLRVGAEQALILNDLGVQTEELSDEEVAAAGAPALEAPAA